MIRVTVPRPAADALMPAKCDRSDCLKGHQVVPGWEGGPESVGPCSRCRGSGSLPPVLRLLVVEGEIEFEPWRHCTTGCEATGRCPVCERSYPPAGRSVAPEAHGSYCEPECDGWDDDRRRSKHLWPGELARLDRQVPAAIVQATEAGERIGLDVDCECACHRLGSKSIAADCRCTDGRLPVGSVRPTVVLPVVDDEGKADDCLFHDGVRWWRQRITPSGEDVLTVVKADLSLYGDPASLVGRFAIAVTDARREG